VVCAVTVLILDPLAQGEPRCPRCGRAAVVAADGEGWEVGCAGPAALCGGVWQGGPGDVLVAVGEAPRAVVVSARG
jgi:hypothetical protein